MTGNLNVFVSVQKLGKTVIGWKNLGCVREASGIVDGWANAQGGPNVNTSTLYSTNVCMS